MCGDDKKSGIEEGNTMKMKPLTISLKALNQTMRFFRQNIE